MLMSIFSKIVLVLLASGALISGLVDIAPTASAGGQGLVTNSPYPVVYVYPNYTTVGVGETFTITVVGFNFTDNMISDPGNPFITHPLGNLYGFDIEFTWDPTILHYVSHTVTTPAGTYPAPNPPSPYGGALYSPPAPLQIRNVVNETGNIPDAVSPETRAWFAYAAWIPALPQNGNCTFFTMTFNVLAVGASPLRVLKCDLPSSEGDIIYRIVKDGLYRTARESYLAVRGAHNEIYYRTYSPTNMSWESWRVIPEGATCDSPAAVVCGSELHVVVRGLNDDEIWHGYVNLTDNTFSGWTLLSGSTPSTPTLTSNGTSLCLIVRGQNNIIYYRLYRIDSRVWSDWIALPQGTTYDSPAASLFDDTLHVVVRGINYNQIWHGYVNLTDETFSGWTLLSGATPSAPTLAANSTALCLVVRGQTDCIYYRLYNLASHIWSDWKPFPLYAGPDDPSSGATSDCPAATMSEDGLHVVVRGVDSNEIWHGYVNLADDTFSGWTLISGSTSSRPTLTSQK